MSEFRFPFLDLKDVNSEYMPELDEAISSVISSGRYTGGEEISRFEENMCRICETGFCVATGNGLDSLYLVLEAYKLSGRLREGDEVIVPANTYIATFLAVSRARLKIVPVDADAATLNLDTSLLDAALSRRTRVVLTVHLYGRVCYDQVMKEFVEKNGLILIEDCAQSIGALSPVAGPRGHRIAGSLGDAAAFSFYPTKNIGALGDGGCVVTSDPAVARTVCILSNYGSDYRYHNLLQGVNSRLDAVQAAVLNVKLKRLDQVVTTRLRRASIYNSIIENSAVRLPLFCDDRSSVFHQYVVLCEQRDALRDYLRKNGVATDVHYPVAPCCQPCYRGEFENSRFPVSAMIASECVSLPIGQPMDDSMYAEIAGIVNGFRFR